MLNKTYYGGQAVIEGVMMRGRKTVVTSVRRPGGSIASLEKELPSLYTGRLRRVPFIRGMVVLVEAMLLGIQSLLYSANVALEEEMEEISKKTVFGMISTAAILVVALFFLAPLFLTKAVNAFLPSSLAFHLAEGVIRLGIFIGYLKIISLMPDIKRVFTYHGAEHKTVNAYEAGVPLEVEAVQKYSTAHVRCGTSFLFAVLVLAIIVFTLVGRQDLWIMIASRVVLIPIIASIGYEVTQFGARHTGNWLIKLTLMPGLLLQQMTTGEPDDDQVEVAVTALRRVIELEEETTTA
ncbi:DUF1385 domain-containing protein [Chloroflexota bacterium]